MNEMQRKMFDSLYDVSAGIRGTIQEKVCGSFQLFLKFSAPLLLFTFVVPILF